MSIKQQIVNGSIEETTIIADPVNDHEGDMLNRPLNFDDASLDFLSNLQGNILKSHGRAHTAHFIIRFNPERVDMARFWLANFSITSALEQQQQIEAYKSRGKNALFSSVFLSADGYRVLGCEESDLPTDLSDRFARGMAQSGAILGDPEQATWEVPYNQGIHAMVLLAHADLPTLNEKVVDFEQSLWSFCEVVRIERGKKLPNGVEHFGYIDGISQPLLLQQDIDANRAQHGQAHWQPEANLNLVLVEEQPGSQTYGSFMVFRKIEQHLDRFDALATHQAGDLRSQAIGRQPDGNPLANRTGSVNDFTYHNDPDGVQCPLHAHIRKANPRRAADKPARIVRRGITYGNRPDLDGTGARPTTGVGLLFISYQATLGQFEQIQFQTIDPDFVKKGVGVDPILGTDLTTFKGGEYFFAPSLSFLQGLATLHKAQKMRFRQVFKRMLDSRAVLRRLQPGWQQAVTMRDRAQAATRIGLLKKDFFALYAYLLPHFGIIRERGFSGVQTKQAQLTPAQKEAIQMAFDNLLEPEQLEAFMQIWRSNAADEGPMAALRTIGNFESDKDVIAFYEYLNSEAVRVPFPLWG